MLKTILGVIIGYIVMALFIFVTFSLVYLAMGADGAYQPGSYEVSWLWLISSIVLGFIGAILGGLTAVVIGKDRKPAIYLAGLVLILGLAMAIPTLSGPDVELSVRTGDVALMDAMQSAHQPSWIAFLNPLIGAVGVMLGARCKKRNSQ